MELCYCYQVSSRLLIIITSLIIFVLGLAVGFYVGYDRGFEEAAGKLSFLK